MSAPPSAHDQDLLARLARRLTAPPEVTPRLGLRFAPTPDLPSEDTARWRRRWEAEDPSDPSPDGPPGETT